MHLDGARIFNAAVATGVLAAAGLVALDTMVDRLADDHENAHALAEGPADVQRALVICREALRG